MLDHFSNALNLQNNRGVFLEVLGKKKLPKNWQSQVVALYGISEDPTYEHEEELDVDVSTATEDDYLVSSYVNNNRYCAVIRVKDGYRIYHTFEDDPDNYRESYSSMEDVIRTLEACYPEIPNKEELLTLV